MKINKGSKVITESYLLSAPIEYCMNLATKYSVIIIYYSTFDFATFGLL